MQTKRKGLLAANFHNLARIASFKSTGGAKTKKNTISKFEKIYILSLSHFAVQSLAKNFNMGAQLHSLGYAKASKV